MNVVDNKAIKDNAIIKIGKYNNEITELELSNLINFVLTGQDSIVLEQPNYKFKKNYLNTTITKEIQNYTINVNPINLKREMYIDCVCTTSIYILLNISLNGINNVP